MSAYKYRLLYRPPSMTTLPTRDWVLIERPKGGYGFERRDDLPLSEHEFGVVAFPSKLTDEEVEMFQLKGVLS